MANRIFTTDNREAFDGNKSRTDDKPELRSKPSDKRKPFFRSAVIFSILLVSIGVVAQTGLLPFITDQAVGLFNRFVSSSSSSISSTSSKTSPSLSLSERYANRYGKFASAAPVPSQGGAGHRDTIGVFRPSNTVAYLRNTNSGGVSDISLVYGDATDLILTGDWDNDGIDSLGIYRNGVFYLRNANTTGGPDLVFAFGAAGDLPIAGDWNADGTDTVGIFRPSTGTFYLRNTNSNGNPDITFSFGASGDQPIAGDWDGDGTDTVGFFRSSTTVFYLKNSNAGSSADVSIVLGGSSDIPVSGDWNNSGVDTVGLYSSGTYYLWNSNNGGSPDLAFAYGGTGDKPITGNWDGLPADPPASNTVSCNRSEKRLGGCNATGGTNLYSRNFAWGTGLAGLPGRSGLDAGFGLSYNSLVWIRKGSQMVFDPDVSNVSPGFRMGFPVIEPMYNDFDTGRNTFIMVTPSGGRVEFRQVDSTNKYETPDSSYGELTLVDSNNITVRGTDGTQVGYTFRTGAFFVNQIKDSNGNYITVNHDSTGTLQSVTDTLGRVITINHDSNGYPTTIQQTWKTNNGAGADTTYTYATLSYTTIAVSANFHSSLTVTGLYNASAVTVLDKVTYPNGAYTKFDYNTLGQVWKITNYAADGTTKLNHTAINIDNSVLGTNLLDVPRFTQTKLWTKDFNNEQEVIIPNTLQTGQSYSVPGASGTGTLVQITAPDGTISKTYFHETGWSEGLPVVTEDLANSTRQRWTWTNWTQDNTGLSYILNPRVTESKVGDNSNIKRTTISYHLLSGNISKYGLVNEVKVYDANQSTVLKTSQTTYNESATYTSRRIIGLPSQRLLYDENSSLMSKVTYNYDEGNFYDSSLEQNIAPVQHDYTNYGVYFVQGRGNLTSATRWDVTQPTNGSAASTSQIKYNTAGSPVAQVNPLNNQVKMSYADSFNDYIGRNSYAYPTKVYDPAGNYSEVRYRYDIGANVWAKSPAPAGNTSGKETEREYDTLGRLTKDKIVNTGAYTRYEYMANGVQSRVYATITDTNGNNTGDSADEVLTESWTDGAGRVLKSGTEHPGSVGGYVATLVEYDIMGRVKKSSVPTEINTNWTPTGDDAARGFLWTQREYDWKGRVTKEINTDGTDKLYTYDGCGCAGGQVTTIKGEYITETDWSGNTTANLGRRTQKVYADILGRNYKTELLDWNGNIYKTIMNFYNGRDQVNINREIAGIETSSNYRETIITYDGHGRLKTQHSPEQDANTATSYTYTADDKPITITDGRGATKHYGYNNLGLISQISWIVPQNSGIDVPATTTFSYDNLGNRISMYDGFGNVQYQYNQLSQMTAETREFNETVPQSPNSDNKFKIEYTYGLAGQLSGYKEPFGEIISYGYDKTGKLKTVSGNRTIENVQLNYVTDTKYRAWGRPKEIDYHGGRSETVNFNNRLQAIDYELTESNYISSNNTTHLQYDYYNDGRLKNSSYIANLRITNPQVFLPMFDRKYEYDFLGRLKTAKTGAEARGQTETDSKKRPYRMTFSYNQFGDIIGQERLHWVSSFNSTFSYAQNGRNIGQADVEIIPNWVDSTNGWTNEFDADGRNTGIENQPVHKYNAEGQISYNDPFPISGDAKEIEYDGDGRVIKIITNKTPSYNLPSFHIKSSVLGEDVLKVWSDEADGGLQRREKIIAGGKVIAERRMMFVGNSFEMDATFLMATDPSGVEATELLLNNSGTGDLGLLQGGGTLDVFGAGVGFSNPYPDQPDYDYPECDYGVDGEPGDPCDIHDFTDPDNEQSEIGSITENTCYVDGWEKNCNYATNLLKSGIADIGPSPSQDSMRIKHPITEEIKWGFFKNYGNEMSGWWADFVPPQEKDTIVFGVDTVGLRYNSPEHIGDESQLNEFWGFWENFHRENGQPSVANTSSADPCAGNKGKIDSNRAGGKAEGIQHLSERHIDPQLPKYVRGNPQAKSYFWFGRFFTKGQPSATKPQRENIMLGVMQTAFENGAVSQLGTNVYAYVYAPYATLPFGLIQADFIGLDKDSNWDATNVRTVVLNTSDCRNPKLITGYPGKPSFRDGRFVPVNGIPRQIPPGLILPYE